MTVQLVRKKGIDDSLRLQLKNEGGCPYIASPVLDDFPWLLHGFSTRLGGVSEGELSSMNMSFAREENRENVRENYRRIASAIGFSPEKLVFTFQTHTNNVRVVREEDAGFGYDRERPYTDIDALVTNVPGIVLAVFMSDCVPLLVADPVNKAIGAAHSGWRGTVHDIGGAMVRKMQEEYGSDPKDLTAVIGQSICQDCYEVSEDVIDEFRRGYGEQHWTSLFYRKENGKYQLNLQEACRINFLNAGLTSDKIVLPDLCTKCNPQVLFSHRVQGGKQGNMAGFISIRE